MGGEGKGKGGREGEGNASGLQFARMRCRGAWGIVKGQTAAPLMSQSQN
jgi:hypothetical protein